MSTFTEKLYGILKNDSGVAAIVSDRIHVEFAAEDALPYVTFFIVSDNNVQGLGARSDRQGPIRVQIDCYSNSLSEVHALAGAVKSAMNFSDTQCTIRVESSSDAGGFAAEGENAVIRRKTIDVVAFCDVALT